jgi:uncharacterized HAD superfamily protein
MRLINQFTNYYHYIFKILEITSSAFTSLVYMRNVMYILWKNIGYNSFKRRERKYMSLKAMKQAENLGYYVVRNFVLYTIT